MCVCVCVCVYLYVFHITYPTKNLIPEYIKNSQNSKKTIQLENGQKT